MFQKWSAFRGMRNWRTGLERIRGRTLGLIFSIVYLEFIGTGWLNVSGNLQYLAGCSEYMGLCEVLDCSGMPEKQIGHSEK